MLMTGILLGLGFTALEIYIVTKFPPLRWLYQHGLGVGKYKIKGEIISVAFSLALSWKIGEMFPAVGLAIITAAVFSTMFSLTYFKAEMRTIEKYNQTPIEYAHSHKGEWKESWDNNAQLFKDLWKLLRWFIRVATFPIWGYRDFRNWMAARKPNTI